MLRSWLAWARGTLRALPSGLKKVVKASMAGWNIVVQGGKKATKLHDAAAGGTFSVCVYLDW